MSYRHRRSWLTTDGQSLSDGLNALESLCAQVLADHSREQQEQQQQQEEEEQTPASELRRFLADAGLTDRAESLDQGLQRLEQMTTEALQEPSTTSYNTQG